MQADVLADQPGDHLSDVAELRQCIAELSAWVSGPRPIGAHEWERRANAALTRLSRSIGNPERVEPEAAMLDDYWQKWSAPRNGQLRYTDSFGHRDVAICRGDTFRMVVNNLRAALRPPARETAVHPDVGMYEPTWMLTLRVGIDEPISCEVSEGAGRAVTNAIRSAMPIKAILHRDGHLIDVVDCDAVPAVRAEAHAQPKPAHVPKSPAIIEEAIGDVVLYAHGEDVLRFCGGGSVFVRGQVVDDDRRICAAVKNWVDAATTVEETITEEEAERMRAAETAVVAVLENGSTVSLTAKHSSPSSVSIAQIEVASGQKDLAR